jgi:hypothetical protein
MSAEHHLTIATVSAGKEIRWMRNLLVEIGFPATALSISHGGRCRRCRECRGCCRRLRGFVSVPRTSALSRASSISLSIGLCLLEGLTLVCAVSRLLTEVPGDTRTTMTGGRRCEQSCVASRALRTAPLHQSLLLPLIRSSWSCLSTSSFEIWVLPLSYWVLRLTGIVPSILSLSPSTSSAWTS